MTLSSTLTTRHMEGGGSIQNTHHELRMEIHTDRTNNHYKGPVPTTYPCPQPPSWLVQVLCMDDTFSHFEVTQKED